MLLLGMLMAAGLFACPLVTSAVVGCMSDINISTFCVLWCVLVNRLLPPSTRYAVNADGDGLDLVIGHHCLWSHIPAGPVPAQQLWSGVLCAVPVPAGHGLLCLPLLHPHPQGRLPACNTTPRSTPILLYVVLHLITAKL